MNKKLHDFWQDFALNLGAKPNRIDVVWEWIESAYSEPHRHYHTLTHIEDCLMELDWVRRGFSKESNDAIELAIWFHDIVYDTSALDNEMQSARLARNVLGVLGISDHLLRAKVGRLINCTKHTESDIIVAEEEDIFLDIDLAILGTDPETFNQYEKDIRKEYDWVPLEMYCARRAEILQSFLDRACIYRSEMLHFYEDQARENLSRSIKALNET